eukprot:1769940-Amphidinium_carterae.4
MSKKQRSARRSHLRNQDGPILQAAPSAPSAPPTVSQDDIIDHQIKGLEERLFSFRTELKG